MTERFRIAHVAVVDLTLRFLLLGQLRHLIAEGYEVWAISAQGPWTRDLEAEGIHHVAWPHATRAWDPISDVRAFEELRAIFRRHRFDLVHTHTPKAGVIGRLAARASGVPAIVNTVHGYFATPDDPRRRRIPVREVERIAARFSQRELFQSEEDLRWARRERIVRPDQAVLLGNGTDLRRFDPEAVSADRVDALRRRFGISRSSLVVATMGRLVEEKGYRQFFDAGRMVHARLPETTFLWIGDREPDERDGITARDLARSGSNVIFTGWREDVPELLALADVFVLASWREGLPRSAVEAAAMGKALVLTDIRGCREVVRDGVEGLLVPPRRSVPLASAIHRLAVDTELRHQLGKAARARALERFDERRVCEVLTAEYRRLLNPKLVGHGERHGAGSTTIRRARSEDASAVATLHRQTMPDAFLPLLGDAFLRLLYRALINDHEAVAFVAERAGRIEGFSAGVRSVRRFYRRFLLGHGVRAAVTAVPALRHPDVVRMAVETLRYPSGTDGLPHAELLSIGVSPDSRRTGTGRQLACAVVEGLAELGVGELKVVVGADNVPANRMYEALGFRLARSITIHPGTTSHVWVMRCRSSLDSASRSS